jgi:hypothetical protein
MKRRRLFGFIGALIGGGAAAKAIPPAAVQPVDPVLKNEPASIAPGMITYVNTTQYKGFKPAFAFKPALRFKP